jgi:hypothetical protein
MFLNFGNSTPFTLLTAGDFTASANGAAVDTQGYDGVARAVFNVAAGTGTFDAQIQSSDDQATWTAVPNAAIKEVSTTGGTQVVDFDCGACGRYVRAAAVVSAGGNFNAAASLLLQTKQ